MNEEKIKEGGEITMTNLQFRIGIFPSLSINEYKQTVK